MRPTDEHLMTIGPWAYLGWVLFAGLAVLYFRLWRSSGVGELGKLKKELNDARKMIGDLRQVETSLKNRNGELQVKLNRLESDNRDMKGALETLKATNIEQGKTIDRMDKFMREQAGRVEYLVGRVIQLDAERGMVTKLPWNEK